MTSDDPSQPTRAGERLEEGDDIVTDPPAWPITKNEIHALVLGAALGLIGAVIWALHPIAGTCWATAFAIYAVVGWPRGCSLDHDAPEYSRSIGRLTMRHEPWWFLPAFLVVMGVVVHAG